MKITIYYFTATGNSLALAKMLSDSLGNCTIKSIPALMRNGNNKIDGEIAGFVFPNHYGKVPMAVKKFLLKSSFENIKYLFAVISGGGGSGYSFNDLKKILKQKKQFLNASMEITMPGNYIIAPYYDFTNRDENGKNILFKESEKKIETLVEIIKEKRNYHEIKNNAMRMLSRLFNIPNNLTDIHRLDINFHADEKCTSCASCEKVCPVNNIKMKENKPEWFHNCQMCMACIQLCPGKAIQYKDITQNKKRYNHPFVTIKEIINGLYERG